MDTGKKGIITIAAALVVAAAAQAGSIDWEITLPIENKDGAHIGPGATVYLVLYDYMFDTLDDAINNGTFNVNTIGVIGSATTTASSTVDPVTLAHPMILDDGTMHTLAVLIFHEGDYGAAGWYTTTEYVYADSLGYTPPGTPQRATFDTLFGGPDWNSYGNVPEPTAMALVALGVAAAGLRRRFRK